MANRYFVARVLMPDGKLVKRILFSEDLREARQDAQSLGGALQDIREKERSWIEREVYTNAFKIGFFRSLVYQIEGGASPANALVRQIKLERSAGRRSEMQRSVEALERGGSFADAITALPFIDPALGAMMQAADAGGDVAGTLKDAIDLLEARSKNWKMVTGAFAWISMDLFSIVSSVFGIQFFALDWFRSNRPPLADPAVAQQYARDFANVELFSLVLTIGTILLIVAAVAAVLLVVFGGPRLRASTQRFLFKIPLLRSASVDGAMAAGMLLLSRLSSAGVPLSRSLDLLGRSTIVAPVADYWRGVMRGLDGGADLGSAASLEGYLTEDEIGSLRAQTTKAHFIYVTNNIASNRKARAEGSLRNLIRAGVGVTLVYMGICSLLVFMLLKLQNTGVMGSFDDLMKGRF